MSIIFDEHCNSPLEKRKKTEVLLILVFFINT